MGWIDQAQRDLGGPVVEFALANWLILLIVLGLAGWWFVNGSFGRNTDDAYFAFGIGDDDAESGDSGDGDGDGD